jgi:hypothetical protein
VFPTIKRWSMVASLICGCGLPLVLSAEEAPSGENPDWPCEQILVPEVPPAVVWAGPSITGLEQAWEQDEEVAALVRRFTSPDYDMEAADGEIADFAARQAPAQKDQRLTLLFAGVIQTLNDLRRKEHQSIMRYARGQAARANRLSEDIDEMVRLQEDGSAAAQERLALMQKEMELKQRMFDEREVFMQHLCTRPIIVEQKLGVLARTIAYYLD